MNTRLIIASLIACLPFAAASFANDSESESGFRPLFESTNLDGWTPTPGGTWAVEDGVIVGKSEKSERRHGILLSDRTYRDFVVKGRFRVLSGDSGFYFRAERVESGVSVNGFQVEVDETQETGGLYETGGRAWVQKPSQQAIEARNYKKGEWADLELTTVGADIVVRINGVVSAELRSDTSRKSGHLGLQLHGGQDMHVEFDDLRIFELPGDDEFTPMFNGHDLSGWQTTGNWKVKDHSMVTLEPREGESGWTRYGDYLTTERTYGDFVLDLEFKFEPKGNSGVFMRVGDLEDHVTSGFEVQILDTHGKEQFGAHDCGGVIGTSAPSEMVVNPAGEWNRYIIVLKQGRLTVLLNGTQIQDFVLAETVLMNRPDEGHISFQDEAKPISYRHVRIRELQ